jgi:hypothetical protein
VPAVFDPMVGLDQRIVSRKTFRAPPQDEFRQNSLD